MNKNKIMVAVLDEDYPADNYPEKYNNDYAHEIYMFDTPQAFIEKWYELDEGRWYWVFAGGHVICSGVVDTNDIEIFRKYFNMSFKSEYFGDEEENDESKN